MRAVLHHIMTDKRKLCCLSAIEQTSLTEHFQAAAETYIF